MSEQTLQKVGKRRDIQMDEKYCPPLQCYMGKSGFYGSHQEEMKVYKDDNGDVLRLLETYVRNNNGHYFLGIFEDPTTKRKEARIYENIDSIHRVIIESAQELTEM